MTFDNYSAGEEEWNDRLDYWGKWVIGFFALVGFIEVMKFVLTKIF
jgi:hypothetical protein